MIFVDDLLVFCGAIRQAPPPPGGGGNGEDFGQCIRCGPGQPLGSSSAEQVRPCQPETTLGAECVPAQPVLCYNEGRLVEGTTNGTVSLPAPSERPTTSWGR